MFQHGLVEDVRDSATGPEVVKMYAVSRLMLGRDIQNLQVSWVKEGPRFAQLLLDAGANDFGGTLINESISTSAGASYGQLVRPTQFRAPIREMGRLPAERTTTDAAPPGWHGSCWRCSMNVGEPGSGQDKQQQTG